MKEKLIHLKSQLRDTAAAWSYRFHALFPGARSAAMQTVQLLKLSLLATGFWIMNKLFISLWGNIDDDGNIGTSAVLVCAIALNSAGVLALWVWAMKAHVDNAIKAAEQAWLYGEKIKTELETANLMKQAFVDAAQFAVTVVPDKPEHFDDWAVDQFALEMKKVLAHKRAEGRSGWNTDAEVDNLDFLCADHANMSEPNFVHVANYAMMVWVRNQFANACANPDLHAGPTAVQLIQEALARKE